MHQTEPLQFEYDEVNQVAAEILKLQSMVRVSIAGVQSDEEHCQRDAVEVLRFVATELGHCYARLHELTPA